MTHQLRTVWIGDEPSSWESAGFTTVGRLLQLGQTTVSLGRERNGGGRIRALSIDGITRELGGIRTRPADARVQHSPHPNHVTGLDHIVVMSRDVEGTTADLEAAGLEVRRTRLTDDGGTKQVFFWLGDVILELVGPADSTASGPAVVWGLALTCADLGAAAVLLGPALGPVKDAVQPGRRIATLRTKDLGISTSIALMSPHTGA